MRNPSLMKRLFFIALATVLFAASGASAWAVIDDFTRRDVMPHGARGGPVALGGLTKTQARAAVQAGVTEPLAAPITVRANGATFELAAREYVAVDVEKMLERAFAPKAAASLPERVYDRISGNARGAAVEPMLSLDEDGVRAWVTAIASVVDSASVDASLTVQSRSLVLTPSVEGARLDRDAAAAALLAALTAGTKRVDVAVLPVAPEITEDDLGMAILVRRADRRLFLYENGVLVKTYRVAVGAPGYSTPKGTWQIVEKRYMPTWGNPGSEWAEDMPSYIGPGPDNPLGTRALNLDAPGIRIHGTNKDYSIGTAASHGCMRMHRWDIEELYDLVDVGTPVIIID